MLIYKIKTRILATVLAFVCYGCVIPSIEPLFTDDDITFDDSLLGEWQGNKSIWKFEKRNHRAYYLSYREGHDPINDPSSCTYAEFEVHLLRLNDKLYLDFLPINYLNTENLFLLCHLIEAHSFAQIEIKDDDVNITFLDYKWMDQTLLENPNLIKHFRVDDNIVLTASTPELQDFVRKYSDYEEAFTSEVPLKRYHAIKTQ